MVNGQAVCAGKRLGCNLTGMNRAVGNDPVEEDDMKHTIEMGLVCDRPDREGLVDVECVQEYREVVEGVA